MMYFSFNFCRTKIEIQKDKSLEKIDVCHSSGKHKQVIAFHLKSKQSAYYALKIHPNSGSF